MSTLNEKVKCWAKQQQIAYHKGKLSPAQVKDLEEVKAWNWDTPINKSVSESICQQKKEIITQQKLTKKRSIPFKLLCTIIEEHWPGFATRSDIQTRGQNQIPSLDKKLYGKITWIKLDEILQYGLRELPP